MNKSCMYAFIHVVNIEYCQGSSDDQSSTQLLTIERAYHLVDGQRIRIVDTYSKEVLSISNPYAETHSRESRSDQ
jgi:hypothetical protein